MRAIIVTQNNEFYKEQELCFLEKRISVFSDDPRMQVTVIIGDKEEHCGVTLKDTIRLKAELLGFDRNNPVYMLEDNI